MQADLIRINPMALHQPHSSIVVVLVFLSNALLALSLSGCSKPAAPVAGPSPASVSVGKPLTDEECLAAAEAISKAVNSDDAAALDRMIDWDSVNQRSTAGINAPEQFRKNFIKGLDQSRLNNKGIANGIVDAVTKGGSYTLLHSHPRDKRRWLLFRLLLPESGLNYHDLLLARRADGTIKVVDMYIYLSGELISESYRRGYLQAVAQNSGGFVDRITGADQKYVKYIQQLTKLAEASRAGKFAEVLSIDKSLPPEIRKEKNVLVLRLSAAQSLGDDGEYTQSMEDFRAEYPKDACIDIISIDYYLLKKQYHETLGCIDRLDLAVQGDPFLQTYRASIHIEQNDLAAARADLKKALEADPGMVDAYWSLVSLSLKENNYDETLTNLHLLRDNFRIEVGDLTSVPLYKEFVQSPQYQEWLKENQSPAEKAADKEQSEKPKQ